MTPRRRPRLAAAVTLAALVGAGPRDRRTWDFEHDEPGKGPSGFQAEAGRWVVERGGGGHSLAQRAANPDDVYNLTLIDGTAYRDVELVVRVKADRGEVDRGGGLIWRARDPKNYYLARWNPLEDNYRVYKVVDGKRTQLRSAKVAAGDGDHGWHTLRVRMVGDRIECDFDGRRELEARDPTFADAGRIGLWSKSDAQSLFDDLAAEAL